MRKFGLLKAIAVNLTNKVTVNAAEWKKRIYRAGTQRFGIKFVVVHIVEEKSERWWCFSLSNIVHLQNSLIVDNLISAL